jgi:pyruvate ferredoxin oxidoreductase gamma subunit
VVSFCRISDHPIRTREPVTEPDALVVQDATLVHQVDLFQGLGPDGYVLLNSSRSFDELGLGTLAAGLVPGRAVTVPATDVARNRTGRPVPNAALLGALAALTGAVSLGAVQFAITERFAGPLAAANASAAADAYRLVLPTVEAIGAAPA